MRRGARFGSPAWWINDLRGTLPLGVVEHVRLWFSREPSEAMWASNGIRCTHAEVRAHLAEPVRLP